jgi:hypothetical protein
MGGILPYSAANMAAVYCRTSTPVSLLALTFVSLRVLPVSVSGVLIALEAA